MAADENIVESPGRPAPAAKIRLPPIGFWSYARQDDDLSQGKLSGLRSLLMFELQQQHGRDQIHIFQDARTIPHGAAWEREIKAALGKATFFIPIITPNFVQSDWCCREVTLFLEREADLQRLYPDLARRSRIFPIQFIDIEDVDAADPAALAALQSLQWFDFRKFRHRSYESEAVREAIADLAGSMRALLKIKVSSIGGGDPTAPPIAAESLADAEADEVSHAPTIILMPEAPAEAAAPSAAPKPASTARPIEIGDVLNHIFEVKRFIKAGGMGQVFEGSNVITGERVAIKALLPALAADPKVIDMLQRESMTLTRLQHEALVQYRMLAKEPELGVLYIATEYIDGVDLGDVLEQVDRSPEALAALLRRLASGLAAAHRLGAIHRDMSPDNVMLPGGDLQQAKIIDFGIAKDLAGALPTIIGDGFAGKLNFVAPEQLGEHDGEIGPWTDVYSLALVILSVAKGEKVDMAGSFADAIRKRREGPDLSAVPEPLHRLLGDMLRLDPAERPRTMDEVIARLAAAAAEAEAAAERARRDAELEAEREREAAAEAEAAEQERRDAELEAEREREAAAEAEAAEQERRDAELEAEREREAAAEAEAAEQARRDAELEAEREREAAAEAEAAEQARRDAELEAEREREAAAEAEAAEQARRDAELEAEREREAAAEAEAAEQARRDAELEAEREREAAAEAEAAEQARRDAEQEAEREAERERQAAELAAANAVRHAATAERAAIDADNVRPWRRWLPIGLGTASIIFLIVLFSAVLKAPKPWPPPPVNEAQVEAEAPAPASAPAPSSAPDFDRSWLHGRWCVVNPRNQAVTGIVYNIREAGGQLVIIYPGETGLETQAETIGPSGDGTVRTNDATYARGSDGHSVTVTGRGGSVNRLERCHENR